MEGDRSLVGESCKLRVVGFHFVDCFEEAGILQRNVLENVHLADSCQFDLVLLVANDWKAQLAARKVVDILDPVFMRFNGVGRQTDQLDTTLGELRLELCEGAELAVRKAVDILDPVFMRFNGVGRQTDQLDATLGELFGVGAQDNALVTDEFEEANRDLGGLSLEVGGDGSKEANGEVVSKNTIYMMRNNTIHCLQSNTGFEHNSLRGHWLCSVRRENAAIATATAWWGNFMP
jgi:hypothetical protein